MPDTKKNDDTTGHIFRIQRYSIHDGPGIRTTIFFQGCPLSCWWCHNPESQQSHCYASRQSRCYASHQSNYDASQQSNYDASRQIPPFVSKRPENCHDQQNQNKTIIPPDCYKRSNYQGSSCQISVIHSEPGTMTTSATLNDHITRTSVNHLMKEIEKDLIFFDESDGGVTFSGGEPLLQPAFLLQLLKKSKEQALHTTVDTSGYAPCQVMEKIADHADLILFDLKLIDDQEHLKYTGVSVKPILRNLKILKEKNAGVSLRFPLIPGITDKKENIDNIISFLLSLEKFKTIQILPYHKAGEAKYQKFGIKNHMPATQPPLQERVESVIKKFKQKGFKHTAL